MNMVMMRDPSETKKLIYTHSHRPEEIAQAKEDIKFLTSQLGQPNEPAYAYYVIPCDSAELTATLRTENIELTNKNAYFSTPKNIVASACGSTVDPLTAVEAVHAQGYAILVFKRAFINNEWVNPKSIHPGQVKAILVPEKEMATVKCALSTLTSGAPELAISMLGWKEYLKPDLTKEK